MNLSKREKFLITILLTVMIVAAYTIYLLLPKWNQFIEHRNILMMQENLLQEFKILQNSKDFNEEEERITNSLNDLQVTIPYQFSLPHIYKELIEIKNDSTVQYESIKFKTPEIISQEQPISGRNLNKLNVDITLYGSYSNIKQYLNRLYSLPRKYTISNLNLRMIEEDIEVSLEVSMYALLSSQPNDVSMDYSSFQGNYGRNNPFN